MKIKKANAFATLLLVGPGLFAQSQQQSSIFAVAEPQVSIRSLPQHRNTAAGTISESGCTVRGFFHQTWTEASQFGRGLASVPRGIVRPSNLKWELPILAATGVLIAEVDRPADNRIQSRSLQQSAGYWSNVGLGLEIGSAALGYGIGCGEHHSYLRDTGLKAPAAMAAAGTVDLGLKLAFDRQFPYTPNSTGKFWGWWKSFPVRTFSHKFRVCSSNRPPVSTKEMAQVERVCACNWSCSLSVIRQRGTFHRTSSWAQLWAM